MKDLWKQFAQLELEDLGYWNSRILDSRHSNSIQGMKWISLIRIKRRRIIGISISRQAVVIGFHSRRSPGLVLLNSSFSSRASNSWIPSPIQRGESTRNSHSVDVTPPMLPCPLGPSPERKEIESLWAQQAFSCVSEFHYFTCDSNPWTTLPVNRKYNHFLQQLPLTAYLICRFSFRITTLILAKDRDWFPQPSQSAF